MMGHPIDQDDILFDFDSSSPEMVRGNVISLSWEGFPLNKLFAYEWTFVFAFFPFYSIRYYFEPHFVAYHLSVNSYTFGINVSSYVFFSFYFSVNMKHRIGNDIWTFSVFEACKNVFHFLFSSSLFGWNQAHTLHYCNMVERIFSKAWLCYLHACGCMSLPTHETFFFSFFYFLSKFWFISHLSKKWKLNLGTFMMIYIANTFWPNMNKIYISLNRHELCSIVVLETKINFILFSKKFFVWFMIPQRKSIAKLVFRIELGMG